MEHSVMSQATPVLAITMGDPAGIGPELVAKVVSSGIVADCGRIICVGDAETLRHAAGVIGANFGDPQHRADRGAPPCRWSA